ncbi:FadR/GntR family transcriptional regulator [Croceicoccus sediminis]|uniref:FadR/GntR family transcriptional regulator n=1 Tax=Croceicoccus sediminis TaxID=2571150 RepID=UPI001182F491|nr:GntR family transcriptional regulator [Croceicoccus sediminis]
MKNNQVTAIRDYVRKAIESGEFPAGEKLPTERELAARFDVPRSAVRSAIVPLEIGGMVKREVGRGTYVLAPGADKVSDVAEEVDASPSDLIEAALSCYPYVCEVAAMKATRADLREIEECVRKVEGARDNEEYRRHDADFHMAIARATQNPLLVELCGIIDRAGENMHWGDLELIEGDFYDHGLIFEALMKRNAGLARTRMEAHLAGARVAVNTEEGADD